MGAADERLRRLADRQTPLIRRTIYAALSRLSQASVESLTEALEAGDIQRAVNIAAGSLDDLTAPLAEQFRQALGAAAKVTAAEYGLRFDLTDPLAVRAAETQAAQLVRQISEETRAAVRDIIAAGIRDGIPPRESARSIRSLVGLTRRDTIAADTYYRRMIADGVSDQQAEALKRRYADRLLRRRAENIARTETIAASTRGARAGWQQAADEGLLDPATARIVWIVTQDDRLCSRCAPMAGVPIGIYEAYFTSSSEATGDLTLNRGGTTPYSGETRTAAPITVDGPPLHPSCRCALGLVFGEAEPRPMAEPRSVPARPEWAPSMTETEARRWAEGSVIPQPMWHATDAADAVMTEGFRDWSRSAHFGSGVYLADESAVQNLWMRAMTGATGKRTALRIQVNVRNPLDWIDAPAAPQGIADAVKMIRLGRPPHISQADWDEVFVPRAEWAERNGLTGVMDSINRIMERMQRGEIEFRPGRAESIAFQEAGFDALRVTYSDPTSPAAIAAGSDQLLVFDPKKVTVISGG